MSKDRNFYSNAMTLTSIFRKKKNLSRSKRPEQNMRVFGANIKSTQCNNWILIISAYITFFFCISPLVPTSGRRHLTFQIGDFFPDIWWIQRVFASIFLSRYCPMHAHWCSSRLKATGTHRAKVCTNSQSHCDELFHLSVVRWSSAACAFISFSPLSSLSFLSFALSVCKSKMSLNFAAPCTMLITHHPCYAEQVSSTNHKLQPLHTSPVRPDIYLSDKFRETEFTNCIR